MPRGYQLARQWRLLQLLGKPQGLAVDGAARELGCDETRWTRWARYSARQDRRMEREGLVGPAQWTHVGSGTTFGLGGYRIEDASSCREMA